MKMKSIMASMLWLGLCVYAVSAYPADDEEDPPADEPKSQSPPPQILSEPKTHVLSRDESVTLHCEIRNADSEAALVWNKDNQSAIYVDDKCFAGHLCPYYGMNYKTNSSMLTINRVNEDTAGNYYCTYRGVSIMHQVLLKVTVEAITGPKSLDYGDTLNLTCRARGVPPPVIVWYLQANETAPSITMGSGPNLTIEHVTSAHSGIYKCTAQNYNNEPFVSRSIQVAVIKGIAPLNPIINAGDSPSGTVNLCCNYGHTKGEASIRWLKNGKDVSADGRHQIHKSLKSKSCMTIMTVKEEDLGTYVCQLVKDTVDSKAPFSAHIELTGIPATPQLLEVSTDSAKTPILKWKVKSFSPLTSYQVRVKKQEQTENDWKVQINKTISSTNREETIEQSLDSISNGLYDVELVVENKFGSARLVSNNKVAVDRPEHEVIAEKIKNGDTGGGASRSVKVSLVCIILGVVLSKL